MDTATEFKESETQVVRDIWARLVSIMEQQNSETYLSTIGTVRKFTKNMRLLQGEKVELLLDLLYRSGTHRTRFEISTAALEEALLNTNYRGK